MASKVLQFTLLLVVFACLAHACKDEMKACKKSDQCCSGYCRKFPPMRNGLCFGPPIRTRRDVIDEDGVQDSNEDDFIENDDDDTFDEEMEDNDSTDILLTTQNPIGKHCARAGTPCNPKSNTCCSKRCVQRRHETISRCARRRRRCGRTSTANPTSTPTL